MAESTATLRQEMLALSGVDIMLDENTFKSTYQIMDELSTKWKDLTDIQQATITELVAGKHQGNIMSALMANFDTARNALDTSLNSSGSAMREHEKWQKSLEAQLLRLKAAWQGLSQSFMKSDFLKGTLNLVIGLVNGLTTLIDTFGTLGIVAIGLAGKGMFNHFKKDKKTIEDVADSIENLTEVIKTGTDATNAETAANKENTASEVAEANANTVSAATEVKEAGANTASTASEVAETEANKKAAASEVTEASANAASTASEVAEANANTASAASEVAEAGANTASAASEVAEAGANAANSATKIGGAIAGIGTAAGKAVGGLKSLIGKLGSLIASHPYIAAAAAALAVITAIFAGQKKKAKELAKEVDNLTEEYKQNYNELKKLKGDYNSSNEDSMISRYEKLSRGVNNLGENVSLTADEYSEYQSITNKIAEQIPSLVAGYDEQGNAILNVKGNVEELTRAYEGLISAENKDIISEADKIAKNFKNVQKQASGYDFGEFVGNEFVSFVSLGFGTGTFDLKEKTIDFLESLDSNMSKKEIRQALNNSGLSGANQKEILQALKDAGVINGWTRSVPKALKKAFDENPEQIQQIIDDYYAQFDTIVEQNKLLAQAYLSEAFDISSSEYHDMSDGFKNAAYKMVSGFDYEFLKNLQANGIDLSSYVNDILSQLNSISDNDVAKFEAAFDLQTQFNGGEISYGEYVNGLKDVGGLIDTWNVDEELKAQLKLSLGLNEDGLVEEYEALVNRLSMTDGNMYKGAAKGALKGAYQISAFNQDITRDDAKKFLDGLSAEELSVLVDIVPELSSNDIEETLDDIQNVIDREMMLRGLSFDLNLEVEATGMEALKTALTESVSASGLSSESISILKSRYAELEKQGYDLAAMFEETSNGVHLNRREFNRLEKELSSKKLDEINGDLSEMQKTYDKLGEDIRNCTDPVEKSKLFSDRQLLAQRINEAAMLASEYQGLTSAYNDWLAVEEAGQERDMYENVIKGFETIDNEISRGWLDDGTIEFLELLTGKDLSTASIEDIEKAYKNLDKTISNTRYSVRDFFTVNEDGESTNTGVYNFLEAVESLENSDAYKNIEKIENLVQRKDGRIVGFNFSVVGGDKAVADALGISEELVQIILRAADDAGFVISLDGTYKQLADLQNEARAAVNYLGKLFNEEYTFDFNTSSIQDLEKQIEDANKILNKEDKNGKKLFWNDDGTFNFDVDGALQAMTIVSTLQAQLDTVTSERYYIGLTVENDEYEESLESLQEYGRTIATLNQLKLNPKANAKEIETFEKKLDEIAQEFINLPDEKKIELGLVGEGGKAFTRDYFNSLTDDKKIELGLVGENGQPLDDYTNAVQKKIESGEIKIPTVLDIQANMDKNLETLADLALLNSGLLSSEQEEAIKIKYKVEVEPEVETNGGGIHLDDLIKQLIPEENIEKPVSITPNPSGNRPSPTGYLLDPNKKEVVLRPQFGGSGSTSMVGGKVSEEALGLALPREANIKIVAETFGIEDVEGLTLKLASLDDKTVQAIAQVLGRIDVDNLKSVMGSLDNKTVQAIAEAIGEGDVTSLNTIINGLDSKTVQAIAEAFGYDGVEELKSAIGNMDGKTVQAIAEALGITDVKSLQHAVDNMHGKTVNAKVNTDGQADKVTALQSAIDGLKGKTVTIFASIRKKASDLWSHITGDEGGSDVNGTANVNGTAFANGTSGRAFKQGDWRTKKSETALVGELGREIVVTPNNRWHTVGDNGAEFANIPRGSIVFNHRQTEELLANGKVTSGGGRGKALVSGTAFANGSSGFGGIGKVVGEAVSKAIKDKKSSKGGSSSSGSGSKGDGGGTGKNSNGSSSGGGSSSEEKEFEETLDWIEIAISRIEREIDNLGKKAENTYKSWSERNNALIQEIGKVGDEIELQEKAAKRYLEEANSVGLSAEWAEKVRNGKVDIETVTDEALAEKIGQYQDWYEKYLACIDAAEELKKTEAELYRQRFENISTQYESVLGVIEHEKNMLDEYINQSETQGWLVSYNYYRALSSNEKRNIEQLEKQKAAMLTELQTAMESGSIEKGSEAWYDLCSEIDGVSLALEEANTRVMEISQNAQQLKWEQFDLLQDKISSITEETEFLIELMSSDKLYDDNGQLTNKGMATMGLHGQNYNTHMYQADQAKAEAERIKAEIESGLYGGTDKYDTELEERYREMIALQQEHILAAQGEKEAIRDMVSEGIELELDALQELIDKKNEALESERDLYEYQKKVKEQTEEIASLEKQMAAYSGDDSEEAKQKVQQIKVDLESARQDLQETEYDKYISDTQEILDDLYEQYSEILNTRLDNLDALVADMIEQVNANANDISATLIEVTDSVSYTMSESMDSIWNASTVSINGAIATYGDKFTSLQTNTNIALGNIKNNLDAMIAQLNTIANTNVKSANTSSATNSAQANATKKTEATTTTTTKPTTSTPTSTTKAITVGGKIDASGAKIYSYAGSNSGSRQIYRNDPIYTVLGEKNGYLKVRYHKLSSGVSGWFKKSDVKAYATGKKNFLNDEIAWTQDGGRELIVRPSDGAILTPVAKGDSVLNAAASGNIWSMANNPAEFIKDNLKLDTANVPNNSTVQSNCVQNFENVTFSMPNVHSYSELLAEMQRDKNFEKLILSMSIDRLAGKSGLAKGKSIR